MPQLPEITLYLRGLWLLVRGDAHGLRLLDISDRGMMRSFWSIVWCLPAMALSWFWMHLIYDLAMPPSAHSGFGFFVRMAMVELLTWIVPLVLTGVVLALSGAGAKFPAVVTIVNWLAMPFSWAFGLLLLLMIFLPGAQGLIALLWLVVLFGLVAAMSVSLRTVLRQQTLLLSAIVLTLIIPGLFLPELLQRFLGIYPG